MTNCKKNVLYILSTYHEIYIYTQFNQYTFNLSILGILRELFDIPKELLFKGQSIKQALNNSLHDLEVNEEGRKYGKENPNTDCRVILKDKIKVKWPQNK